MKKVIIDPSSAMPIMNASDFYNLAHKIFDESFPEYYKSGDIKVGGIIMGANDFHKVLQELFIRDSEENRIRKNPAAMPSFKCTNFEVIEYQLPEATKPE